MGSMRTLLVGAVALGLAGVLAGCEQTATKPVAANGPVKTPDVKTPDVKTPDIKTPPVQPPVVSPVAVPTTLRAVPPTGPALPPVAGKTVAGKTAIRTACGGKNYTDKNGVVWSADQAYSAANKWGYVGKAGTTGSSTHALDALDSLYTTERWGMTSYQYDVPNGNYIVRLHFAEIYDQAAKEGLRVFTVNLQGAPVLDKYDITKDTGGFGKVVVKEFPVTVTNGKIVIGFAKITSRPIIEAIEVLGQ